MTSESGEVFEQSDAEAERRRDFMWEHNPPNTDAYYAEKEAELFSGRMTWMVRDFTTVDRVYELVYKGNYIGSLDTRHGMDALGNIPALRGTYSATTIPGSFFEVLDALEAYAIETFGELEQENDA